VTQPRPRPPSDPAGCNVLITGGAGFIGANLADSLAAAGHRVVVLDTQARAGVEHCDRAAEIDCKILHG
jgi:CDP-paratose 2-epimerase